MDDAKLLTEALGTVKIQMVQMKRCLENDQLMDALKSASTMLAELRTSSLSPKMYYELYMAVFDALRHVSNYLLDAHTSGRHHLADLYELVQYAGNIVPRLYLMITVGSVYMSIPEAPVKEIMKDMMEMSRGVQHPTRGLFLRHYLSGQTRDHLPVGDGQTESGNLHDSITFVLTNFIEMNKLWVRLQHQGHSREREKREMERRELRILVGTNLVRLSQLEGVDLNMYRTLILPSILEQIVSCKDVIAQEYLMEVVIQVFTDDFHLHTLTEFLSATAKLHPKVNIKQIVSALIDRLASYAAREAENEDPEEVRKQEEAAAKRLAEKVRRAREANGGSASPTSPSGTSDWGKNSVNGLNGDGSVAVGVDESKGKEKEGTPPKKFRGIPEDVKLFEVFWQQVVELIKARPDLSIQDITALLVSLINLALSCYPDRLEYVDQVLAFAQTKVGEFQDRQVIPDLHTTQTTTNLLSLLLAPITSYTSVLTLLALPHYTALLAPQPFATRRAIAHAVVASVLKNNTIIDQPSDVGGVLEMCHVLVRDQRDAGAGMGMGTGPGGAGPMGGNSGMMGARPGMPSGDIAEEQGWVARMVHLFRAEALDVQFELLQTARRFFAEGGPRMRYTFPPLIISAINLARRFKAREHLEIDWHNRVTTLFKFIHQLTSVLFSTVESPDTALRLFLLAAQVCDSCGAAFEELAYEFYVQAFTVYEDAISESRAQLQAIALIIGTLQGARVFGEDNYDTLITKAAVHGAKLLKKPHQATAVMLASHMWWQTDAEGVETEGATAGEDAEERKPRRDGKRVLECLQKSLRIASSCFEEIVSVQLYVDALDKYLYYFEHGVQEVTPKYINSLIELIASNVDTISAPDFHPTSRSPPGLVEGVHTADMILRHFKRTLLYIESRKGEGDSAWEPVDGVTGNVYELGSTRYNELVPVEERLPGSRAAVVVDVHKVGTSCGFSVPLYKPDGERTILQDWTDGLETLDQEFANEKEGFEMTNPLSHLEFIPSSSDPTKDDRNPRGMKEYWAQENIRSIDGLPGLRFCRELVGLPPGPVKDDHKVFYIDMEAERLGKTLGSWTQQVVRKVGETGFLGGLAIGLALPLIWIHSTR
ncbi:vacuolar protein sorting-associated protein 35 [Rhizoctonia solani]|uniref:Vacuolar protein sorting-associated protein 35 n=1 Tax=Rhizoctonia solani TaxID=456999 RepID=A0A8H8SWP7_9AGAM|nr:vacuolar protein sorting-associated protein 35 [Rhizoctonia solani]QRW19737.1 vacuolar protein sorting-associated protein 35 [Rhizoctonia solani]